MESTSFRWRSVVEVGLISAVLYIFIFGFPAYPATQDTSSPAIPEVSRSRAKIESLVYPDKNLQCGGYKHSIHILSTDPLVIYIDGFVSDEEADHLIDISTGKWKISTVFTGGVESLDQAVRKSEKALIDRDTTVQCVEQRALAVQGWPADTFIERLWTQRYNETGHYAHHYDWSTSSKKSRRVSTFMVYLSADCTGGGTNFPMLRMPDEKRWCEFIECDSRDEGVTFKARKGSAVFWMNFDAAGRSYKETIHAGMPVLSGTKVGLNIWSWYQAGHLPEAV